MSRFCSPVVFALLALLAVSSPLFARDLSLTAVDPLTPILDNWPDNRPGSSDTLRLFVPRNGVATRAVILEGSPSLLASASPSLSAVRSDQANLDPDWLTLHFGTREQAGHNRPSPDFEVLTPTNPQPSLPFLPIYLTVDVPVEAEPGVYRGTLTVTSGVTRVTIPLEIEILPFLMPHPEEMVTYVSFYQSPEGLAWQYDVPLWSEEHLDLIGQTFRQMRRVGQKTLTLYVYLDQYMGSTGNIPFRRLPNGNLQPDFSFAEKYLRTFKENAGQLDVVSIIVWSPQLWHLGGRTGEMPETLTVAMVDDQDNWSQEDIPMYGPEATKPLWREVLTGSQDLLNRLGWEDTMLTIGVASDQRPNQAVVQYFDDLVPGIPWFIFTHGRGDPDVSTPEMEFLDLAGMKVGLYKSPFGPFRGLRRSSPDLLMGWNFRFRRLSTARFGYLGPDNAPVNFLVAANGTVEASVEQSGERWNWRGLSGVGMDFFTVPIPGRRVGHAMQQIGQGWPRMHTSNTRAVLAAGPDGPLRTMRWELLVQGTILSEARFTLERVLSDSSLARELSRERREEIQTFLSEWNRHRFSTMQETHQHAYLWDDPKKTMDRYEQLLRYAAEAQSILVRAGQLTLPQPEKPRFEAALARTWTDTDGRTTEAVFQNYRTEGVQLILPDNRIVTLPLGRFSEEDQTWIRQTSGFRLWQNDAGQTIEARLIGFDGSLVEIERLDGATFQFPVNRLSEDDQNWLQKTQ